MRACFWGRGWWLMVFFLLGLLGPQKTGAYSQGFKASPDQAWSLIERELSRGGGLKWHLICRDISLSRCTLVSKSGSFTPLATIDLRYPAVRGLRQSYLEANLRYLLADKWELLLELRRDQARLEAARKRAREILKELGVRGDLLVKELPGYLGEGKRQSTPEVVLREADTGLRSAWRRSELRGQESLVRTPVATLRPSGEPLASYKASRDGVKPAAPTSSARHDYSSVDEYGLLGQLLLFLAGLWGWVMDNLILVSVVLMILSLLISMARRL